MKGTGEERCSRQGSDVRRGEEPQQGEIEDQVKLSVRLYLHAIRESELPLAM